MSYITSQCQEEFNNHSLILVSGNGLPIEHNEATRGTHWRLLLLPVQSCVGSYIIILIFKCNNNCFFIILLGLVFWKANSRKVFAITAPVKKEVGFVHLDADDTDSDNSETAPAVRKGLMIHVLIISLRGGPLDILGGG